jgi:hypothetical protein
VHGCVVNYVYYAYNMHWLGVLIVLGASLTSMTTLLMCESLVCGLCMLELLHTHLGFIFCKVFPCLLVIISHYPVSYMLGENIQLGEYSLSINTSV